MEQIGQEDSAARSASRSAQRSRLAQWSSLAALTISALALATGAYQTHLLQTQARASVWPYVVLAIGYTDSGETPGFELHVQNNGVGPAVLRSVKVSFDGKPIAHWSEIFDPLMGHGSVDATLSGLKDVVIPPSANRDTDVIAIRVRQADAAKAIYDARSRLAMEICYCSIYDDCWIAHWLVPRPEPTASCSASTGDFDF
jgi:hypothetical protein